MEYNIGHTISKQNNENPGKDLGGTWVLDKVLQDSSDNLKFQFRKISNSKVRYHDEVCCECKYFDLDGIAYGQCGMGNQTMSSLSKACSLFTYRVEKADH